VYAQLVAPEPRRATSAPVEKTVSKQEAHEAWVVVVCNEYGFPDWSKVGRKQNDILNAATGIVVSWP
jgi:hypothetical protein